MATVVFALEKPVRKKVSSPSPGDGDETLPFEKHVVIIKFHLHRKATVVKINPHWEKNTFEFTRRK